MVLCCCLGVLSVVLYLPKIKALESDGSNNVRSLYFPERDLKRGFLKPPGIVQRVVRRRRLSSSKKRVQLGQNRKTKAALFAKKKRPEIISPRTVKAEPEVTSQGEKKPRLFSNPFGILGHRNCVSSFPDGRGEAEGSCYNEVECVVKGGR